MISSKFSKLAGGCGIFVLIVFLAMLFLSIQQVSWFSWTDNAISDLGRNEGVPSVFNNGLIVTGILMLVFSLGLANISEDKRSSSLFFGLSSIFLIATGFIPLPKIEHIYVSSLFFVSFTYAFFAFGISFYQDKNDFLRKMGYFAILNLIIAIISPVFLLFFEGVAIPEMIVIFPGSLWFMIFGLKMVKS